MVGAGAGRSQPSIWGMRRRGPLRHALQPQWGQWPCSLPLSR
jgi:hypothetical protein